MVCDNAMVNLYMHCIYVKKEKYLYKNNIWIGLGALYIFQITVTMFIQPKVGRYLFYIIICMTAYLYAYIGMIKIVGIVLKKNGYCLLW